MSQRFIRCPHCGMPHGLGDPVCPTTGKSIRRTDSSAQKGSAQKGSAQKVSAPGSLPISIGRPASAQGFGAPAGRDFSLVGRIISEKYGVKNVIGEGGMGTVYEAEHLTIGRRVAIKVLNRANLGRREAVIRFYNEARAAGSIGHPNICEVYDVGRLDDGSPYLVMELLQGKTLSERINIEGALPFEDVISVVTQVLSALTAAHEKTIIHRDIKPENIFLSTRPGCPPVAKILDFGISKTESDDPDLSLTRTGMVMGTPFYMAPEQARGEQIDYRVDLYACGVILYESLTGRRPFIASNYNALVIQVLSAEPRDPREIRPAIPGGFIPIISKAMSKKRDHRYRSALEFLADLNALKEQISRGMSASDISKFVQDVRYAPPVSPHEEATGDRDSFDIPVDFSETGTGQRAAVSGLTPTDLFRDSVEIPCIVDETPAPENRAALEQYEPRRSSALSRKTKAGSEYDEVNDTIVDATGNLLGEFWAQMKGHDHPADATVKTDLVSLDQADAILRAAELRKFDFDSDDEAFRLRKPSDTSRPPESAAGRYFMVQRDEESGSHDVELDSVSPDDLVEDTSSEPPPAIIPRAAPAVFARIEPTRVVRPATSPRAVQASVTASAVPRPLTAAPRAAAPAPRAAAASRPAMAAAITSAPRPATAPQATTSAPRPATAAPRPPTAAPQTVTGAPRPAAAPKPARVLMKPVIPEPDDDDDEATRLFSNPKRAGLVTVDLSGQNVSATEPAPAPSHDSAAGVSIPIAPRAPRTPKF